MFRGSNVAIITPFQNGAIDFDCLKNLIEFHIEQGTDGIVPCGTTGESATLSEEEHQQVVEFTIKTVNKRVPVIAGTGSNSTQTAIELTKKAEEMGADAALVITPYYNKPTQEGLFQHFSAVADAVKIPIIVYNVPGRTGVNILPATVARLAAAYKHIVGLKDAAGSLSQASETLRLVNRDDFCLLSGEDAIVFPMLAIGAAGVISVTANLAPSLMSELISAFEKGNYAKAKELHYTLLPLCDAMFLETNPSPVKTALAMMGKCSGEIRLPLVQVEPETREKLQRILKEFSLL